MTQHQHESKGTLQVEPLVDPVCGMTVSPSSEHCLKYEGREYRFCSGKCLTKFEESPNHYLKKREVRAIELALATPVCLWSALPRIIP